MFSTTVFVALAVAGFAAAGHSDSEHCTTLTATAPATTPTSVSQCNTGEAQCCNTIQSAESESASKVLGLVGVVVEGVGAQVGLGCTPITAIGLGQGANCAQQPACCQHNQFNGLVNVGCTPVSL